MLSRKGIETYLPLLAKTRRYTRKIVEYRLPLIPTYVFVRIDQMERRRVLETAYVHGFVSFGGKTALIPEKEIEDLRRIVGDKRVTEIEPLESGLVGLEVELISGALTGIRGRIIDRCGKQQFLVELKTIGYALYLEVEANHLRKVA